MPIHPAHPSRSRLLRACALALALCALPRAAAAQDPRPQRPDTIRADTVVRAPIPVVADTVMGERPDSVEAISPRGAFLRSLVLPGWGQSELGAPGRGGIYFALEAGSLWMYVKSARKLDEARENERIARETGVLAEGQIDPLVRDRQNQREDWLTLSIFWLFFSGADAFVTAHLQDFDVHVNAIPRPGGALELQATVPVGGP
ncbi:MAG TPA: DUF5683 domain-containing protein [Longimicrobium sp.]